MADTTPQVAPISVQQPPTMAATPPSAPDFSNLIRAIGTPAVPTAPQTIPGTELTTPNLAPSVLRPPQQMMSQVEGTDADKKRARIHNTVAGVTNSLNQFAAQQQEKKQTALKTEIATVMKAQQQIDNANAVLVNDPNNANAKAVIAKNKEIIQAKFSDKKTAKDLQKAFDVSFVDPSKNQTPEVKAMQAARKEVQAATASGLDANTPQERAVARVAMGAAPAGARPVGSITPQMQARPALGAAPTAAPAVTPGQMTTPAPVTTAPRAAAAMAPVAGAAPTTAAPSAAQVPSTTPLADQFLKQQVATIAENPLYASQLAQQQKQQNLREQYLLPKIFDAQAKYQEELMKQGAMDKRTAFVSTLKYYAESQKTLADIGIADAKIKAQLEYGDRKNAQAMAIEEKKLNAQYGAADAPDIKGTQLGFKIQEKTISDLTENINRTIKADADLDFAIKATPEGDHKLALIHSRDMNDLQRAEFERRRQEAMTKFYGISSKDKIDDYLKGYGGTSQLVEPSTKAEKPTATKTAPTGEASRAGALGLGAIPEPIAGVRKGAGIDEGAIKRNAAKAGIDMVKIIPFRNKPAIVDKNGNVYDADTYKRIGTTEPPTGVERTTEPTVVGATTSDEDSAAESEGAEQTPETGDPELDQWIHF